MLFYDFESFTHDWMVVVADTKHKCIHRIHNSVYEFISLFNDNRDDVWIGYNSNHYDQWMASGVFGELSPDTLYKLSNALIKSGKSGYHCLKKYGVKQCKHFYNYDAMPNKQKSLKQLEGFMGSNIHECSIPWDINRPLTEDEIAAVMGYCQHDVEELMKVHMHTHEQNLDAMMMLVRTFELPLSNLSKSEAQISAHVLGAIKQPHHDEFNISIIDTLDVKKYKHVVDWYRQPHSYDETLVVDVADVSHIFGWGGIHGAIPQYVGDGFYVMSDIRSMHPALMIEYGFISRNVKNPEKYRKIRDDRVVMKKAKNPKQLAYKLVLNATNGAAKDQYNPLYDPMQNNNVCVNAQLVLLDLIEHVEDMCELIQSNTDGILVKLKSKDDYDEYIARCDAWEERTRLQLEHDLYNKVYQKDVNNYIIVEPSGAYKSKGAYVKKLSEIDNDLAILNDALINYFVYDISVEDTIYNCKSYKRFQKIVKRGPTFQSGQHNRNELEHKVYRVFASNNPKDGAIYWKKGCSLSKVGNTPDHCFIDNDDINRKRIPRRLDKQYYVDVAHKRISDFLGVDNHKQIRLF